MTHLKLTGLDAQNPLAFFAALGLLRIVDDWSAQRELERPRLSFEDDGQQVPLLWTSLSFEQVAAVVLEDAAEQRSSPIWGLSYTNEGVLLPSGDPSGSRDLKPSPSGAKALLALAMDGKRRDADLVAGLLSEMVQDNKGNTKPTSFHFTAGQQAFLGMVEELRSGLDRGALDEALLGPWQNASKLPSLSWDCSVTRLYALRAADPSSEKRGSVPAANWLGVHGLAFFPVYARPGRDRLRLETTGVEGGWKSSTFRWPVWVAPSRVQAAAGLLRLDPRTWTQRQREAYGVSAVFESRILRTDQGGYGSFCPPGVVPAARRADRGQ